MTRDESLQAINCAGADNQTCNNHDKIHTETQKNNPKTNLF